MYPVQLNLKDKHVVIIGGGKIAYRKYKKLMNEPCTITVVSKEFFYDFTSPNTHIIHSNYNKKYIQDADIIFATTDCEYINNKIVEDSKHSQLVNHTGDRKQSDFYNMKSFNIEDIDIHISSNGKNIEKVKEISNKIKEFLNNKGDI